MSAFLKAARAPLLDLPELYLRALKVEHCPPAPRIGNDVTGLSPVSSVLPCPYSKVSQALLDRPPLHPPLKAQLASSSQHRKRPEGSSF